MKPGYAWSHVYGRWADYGTVPRFCEVAYMRRSIRAPPDWTFFLPLSPASNRLSLTHTPALPGLFDCAGCHKQYRQAVSE